MRWGEAGLGAGVRGRAGWGGVGRMFTAPHFILACPRCPFLCVPGCWALGGTLRAYERIHTLLVPKTFTSSLNEGSDLYRLPPGSRS